MDSVTHIVLGACIGEAILGNKIGKRAMFLGAVSQSIPDIDFVSSLWLSTTEDLVAHRGFTHSILFILLVAPLLGMFSERIHRPHNISLNKWMFFFAVEMMVHIFLDAFNNYGVGWFEPFSHMRISFNAIYVADPLFTLIPLIAFLALVILRRSHPGRKKWWRTAIVLSCVYLGYSLLNKYNIDKRANAALASQGISYERYFTTPAPLQNILWMVVAGNDSGYHVGFRSLLDTTSKINFQFFPRNDSLLEPLLQHDDVKNLIRFSQGFYTVDSWGDTLIFNDLRFGQIVGWQDPKEKFVFHYYLEHPAKNVLVVQRGRFARWDKDAFKFFVKRMLGK